MKAVLFVSSWLAFVCICVGGEITVDDDGPADFNTVQAAIDAASAGDEVVVYPGVYTGDGNRDITYGGKAITVRSTEPNDPDVVGATVIDCQGSVTAWRRGFVFDSGEDSNSVLEGLTIMNGFADAGGGIYCDGSGPLIRNCRVMWNTADVNEDDGSSYGGGLYCADGNCTLLRCEFSSNGVADRDDEFYGNACGGAIYKVGGNIEIRDCRFSDNICGNGWGVADGGGICAVEAMVVVMNCEFRNNMSFGYYGWPEANVFGGAMSNEYCTVTLDTCVFEHNRAVHEGQGGAVYNYACEGTINNCDFTWNDTWIEGLTEGEGGAVYNYLSPMVVRDCRFVNNEAGWEGYGGALIGDDLDVYRCLFERNGGWGGAGAIGVGGQTRVVDCDFINNETSCAGGGIDAWDNAEVIGCLFKGNDAGWEIFGGGGAWAAGNSRFVGCIFSNNYSVGGGGMEVGYNCNVTVSQCTFIGNRASYGAGICSTRGGTVTLNSSILWSNIAAEFPQLDIGASEPNYCCIEGWTGGGVGNIVSDPCFAVLGYWDDNGTPAYYWDDFWVEGDYHLKSEYGQWSPSLQSWVYDEVTSVCIDAGDPCSDWTGERWPHGRRINMGAYGGTAEASMSPSDTGLPANFNCDCKVGLEDYGQFAAQWYGGDNSMTIPRGKVTVDGDLSDWSGDIEWVKLDKIYYGNPVDVNDARMALKWSEETGKIYAAIVVEDGDHVLTDDYIVWNASDRLEVYSQGSGTGGTGWWHPTDPVWDAAQQYMVGPDTSGGYWATWGNGWPIGEGAEFECAARASGDLIVYEIGVKQFDNYGGISGEATALTDLREGGLVRFDLVIDSLSSQGFGMVAENDVMEKYKNADAFAVYTLVQDRSVPGCAQLAADLNRDCVLSLEDLQTLAVSWLAQE